MEVFRSLRICPSFPFIQSQSHFPPNIPDIIYLRCGIPSLRLARGLHWTFLLSSNPRYYLCDLASTRYALCLWDWSLAFPSTWLFGFFLDYWHFFERALRILYTLRFWLIGIAGFLRMKPSFPNAAHVSPILLVILVVGFSLPSFDTVTNVDVVFYVFYESSIIRLKSGELGSIRIEDLSLLKESLSMSTMSSAKRLLPGQILKDFLQCLKNIVSPGDCFTQPIPVPSLCLPSVWLRVLHWCRCVGWGWVSRIDSRLINCLQYCLYLDGVERFLIIYEGQIKRNVAFSISICMTWRWSTVLIASSKPLIFLT